MKPYRIPEMATKYIAYDMIHRYTGLPAFAESRTRLLYAALASKPATSQHSELYALVAGLLQLGLDTHDWIDTDRSIGSEADMRARQLKVLGGDYFSGRFYHLLAQAGELAAVQTLSAAAYEINRLKMDQYIAMQQEQLDGERYIAFGVAQRAELLLAFTSLLDDELAACWPLLVETVSRAELLAAELDRLHDPAGFHWGLGYWLLQQEAQASRADIHERLADELKQSVAQLYDYAETLGAGMAAEVRGIGDALLSAPHILAPAFNETR